MLRRATFAFAALVSVGLLLPASRALCGEPISGAKLAALLDSMDVEHHWLPGRHLKNWRTGVADDKPLDGQPHTHCSAFVAAVCEKLGIPILSPPPQTHLANRQRDWLLEEGKAEGWKRVSMTAAQQLAAEGHVVVASFKNDDPKYHGGHGHIAIVRPSAAAVSASEGPTLIQAGGHNYRAVSAHTAFAKAWEKHEVMFFAFLGETK